MRSCSNPGTCVVAMVAERHSNLDAVDVGTAQQRTHTAAHRRDQKCKRPERWGGAAKCE